MKKLKVGDSAEITKAFLAEDVLKFASMSGDKNPIHFDSEYAATTIFKKTIVQGVLVSSLFGGLLGSILPGSGTIYLGQDLKFLAPTFVGDSVRAIIEITSIRKDKPIYTLSTKCYNSEGVLTIDGKAVILYNDGKL